jgi:hypothetical protein
MEADLFRHRSGIVRLPIWPDSAAWVLSRQNPRIWGFCKSRV